MLRRHGQKLLLYLRLRGADRGAGIVASCRTDIAPRRGRKHNTVYIYILNQSTLARDGLECAHVPAILPPGADCLGGDDTSWTEYAANIRLAKPLIQTKAGIQTLAVAIRKHEE